MSRTNQILAAYAIEPPRTATVIGAELEIRTSEVCKNATRLASNGYLACLNPGGRPKMLEITTRGRQRLADACFEGFRQHATPSVELVRGALSGRSLLESCWGGS